LDTCLRQGVGLAVKHNFAGKLACGDFLIRVKTSFPIAPAEVRFGTVMQN
jgi:hypothetical protein